jgi:hypothetical protein
METIAELERKIASLRERADALAAEFKEAFAGANSLRRQLEDVQREADDEANEMRQCFEEASSAYEDGDGATAKELSEEGHEHRESCEELNERAQELREDIRRLSELGKRKQSECEALNRQVGQLTQELTTLRSTSTGIRVVGNQLIIGVDVRCVGLDDARLALLNQRLSDASTLQAVSRLLDRPQTDIQLLIRGLSNPALDERLARMIPGALAELLSSHPETTGLFVPLAGRGPGARAWVANLANPVAESAAGTAYEVLAARRLLHVPAGNLSIGPRDRLAFGPKLQARYEPDSMKVRDLLAELVTLAPQRWSAIRANPRALGRKTVESDLQIGRASALEGFREIFVDFKYSAGPLRHLDPAELLGVAVALATGEIHEAHFVCSAGVSQESLSRIDDINKVLKGWDSGSVHAHQHYTC